MSNFRKRHVATPPPPAVENVDYDTAFNNEAHKTNYYAITQRWTNPALIIRRGQAFHIQITFEEDIYPDLKSVKLVFIHYRFVSGKQPNATETRYGWVKMVLDINAPQTVQHNDWNVTIVDRCSRALKLAIVPSASCMIGQWQMGIFTRSPDRDFVLVDQFDNLHILCNPWCQDDDCYVRTQRHPSGNPQILTPDEVEDCVINDTGCIFMGTRQQVVCRPWHYAQFYEGTLETVYSLLDRMPAEDTQEPIEIAKFLMERLQRLTLNDLALANMHGKNVVLNISGTFGLIGKMKALNKGEKLFVSDHMLAALFTSLCRAIGIPSRCVTCYDRLNPIPWNEKTKYQWGTNGRFARKEGGSRWAYHVWSEIYCKRTDLEDTQNDGWQLFDHNRSEDGDRSMVNFGPASMIAIKNKRLADAEDTDYFVRSISGSINHNIATSWFSGAGQDLVTPFRCGSLIVTRKAGLPNSNIGVCFGKAREITELYKEPQPKSVHEIRVIDMETRKEKADSTQEVKIGMVMFEDSLEKSMVGDNFGCDIWATNTSEEHSRRINARLVVYAVNQYGEDRTLVYQKVVWNNYELKPKRNSSVNHKTHATADIDWDKYKNALKPGNHFHLVLTASTKVGRLDSPQHTIIMEDFQLRLPNIYIKVDKDDVRTPEKIKTELHHLRIGETIWVTFGFINPLPIDIDDWSLSIEGACMQARRLSKRDDHPSVPPGERFLVRAEVTPLQLSPGRVGTLIVTFHHPYLQGAFGSRRFMLHPHIIVKRF